MFSLGVCVCFFSILEQIGRERIYISYDSTNKNCQAGEIELAEFGHAKTDIGLAIINYSVGYDLKNKEPLFYEAYPGSINDVSQLRTMLGKITGYGYKKSVLFWTGDISAVEIYAI